MIGVPLDFRLGFGAAFAPEAEIVVIDVAEPERDHPRAVAAELYGSLTGTLEALRAAAGAPIDEVGAERERWLESLWADEDERRAAEIAEREDPRAPLHPMRVYAELAEVLDRDAIVVGDGGDFVSYAGRVVDSYLPGCWLDPGPFGCLGRARAMRSRRSWPVPTSRWCCCSATARSGLPAMEFDTMARHGIPVVAVMGNNGIWGLEKHPMEFLYGYSVAADLRPGTRYDEMVRALGCHGELVSAPEQLRPALERALRSGKPALVNVLTDPSVAYPRRSNLA